MSFLGGSSGVKTSTPPTYTCVQIQTSVYGLPIPMFWGTQAIVGNCIGYFNFQASSSKKSSSGKGGKSGNQTYSAAVTIGLAEGSVTSYNTTLGRMWVGTSETTLESFGGGIFPGTSSQAPWSYGAANGQDNAYPYTVYYANASIDLGSAATLPNIKFELFGSFNNFNVPSGTPDANFGDIIPDFLANTRYGGLLRPSALRGFNEGGLLGSTTSLLVYHYCAGIYVSPLLKDAEQVKSILQRWASVGDFWIFWDGVQIVCVPLGDTPLSRIGPHGQMINYVPNTTPVYDLGPDDFVVSAKNGSAAEPPVKVQRKDPADGFNQVQLNCSIRTTNGGVANSPAYQDTPYRWEDKVSVDSVGVQAPKTISSTEICNAGTAAVVVSLIGQRAQFIRNDYLFKLHYYFVAILPGDILTLTEPLIGLDRFFVRVKTIEEGDDDMLSLVCEEFAYGTGSANVQEFEPQSGMAPYNNQTPPGPVNTPAFLQPSAALAGQDSELWIALSGGPNAGGCGVFVSFDDITYSQIGTVDTPSLQGTLTAELPLATGLDTGNTLAIDLTECQGVMPATATPADAQAGRTLALVDGELLAYGMVTPEGAYTANLTYLERGLYGTAPADHAAGAPFARIDASRVFQYKLPGQYVGQPIYFQFPTVNLFGGQAQSLADCVTYEFTPDNLPVPQGLAISYVYVAGDCTGVTLTWGNAAGPIPQSFGFRVSEDPSSVLGRTYTDHFVDTPGATSAFVSGSFTPGDTLYWSMQAVSGAAASDWTADVILPVPVITAAANIYNPDGTYAGLLVTWTQPAGLVPTGTVIGWNGTDYATAPAGSTRLLVPAAQALAGSGRLPAIATAQAQFGTSISLLSEAVGVTGAPTFPALLGALTATPAGAGAVRLSWSPAGGPAPTYYAVLYWVGSYPYPVFETLDIAAPASDYTVSGLTSGQSYTFSVVTYNAAGTGDTFSTHGIPNSSPQASATAS